ncbi:MAG: hypothetical protein LBF95_10255 [Treponema sp.]|jgi:hypothetical protein|nr:hypothetical protein [Treponema sp.]
MKPHNWKSYVLIGIIMFIILILSTFIYIIMPRGAPSTIQSSDRLFGIVREGDIICRLGDRLWSQLFKDVSVVDKRYSHMGIININNGLINVINAEGNTGHGRDSVNEVTLDEFLKVARAVGIYRVKDIEGGQIANLAIEYIGTPFDWKFDLYDESKLYCTELLYVILGRIDQKLKLNTVYIKGLGKEIIPLESISQSEYFSEIYFQNNDK